MRLGRVNSGTVEWSGMLDFSPINNATLCLVPSKEWLLRLIYYGLTSPILWVAFCSQGFDKWRFMPVDRRMGTTFSFVAAKKKKGWPSFQQCVCSLDPFHMLAMYSQHINSTSLVFSWPADCPFTSHLFCSPQEWVDINLSSREIDDVLDLRGQPAHWVVSLIKSSLDFLWAARPHLLENSALCSRCEVQGGKHSVPLNRRCSNF